MEKWLQEAKNVRTPYQIAALALVAAVAVVAASTVIALACLILGAIAFVYGLIRPGHHEESTQVPAEVNPAMGNLFAIADEHIPQHRPNGVDEFDWLVFRHLKSDQNQGLGRAGDIPARYFVDLREAALVPDQCDFLARRMADHIRECISVENHHGIVIPKSGNTAFGLAVARELGLGPVVVRDWPFYGRWVETLITHGRCIVVDDVSTNGELLIEAADRARDAGFTASRAFLLIQRDEGNAAEVLESSHRLSLSALHTLSDVDLDELQSRVRRGETT